MRAAEGYRTNPPGTRRTRRCRRRNKPSAMASRARPRSARIRAGSGWISPSASRGRPPHRRSVVADRGWMGTVYSGRPNWPCGRWELHRSRDGARLVVAVLGREVLQAESSSGKRQGSRLLPRTGRSGQNSVTTFAELQRLPIGSQTERRPALRVRCRHCCAFGRFPAVADSLLESPQPGTFVVGWRKSDPRKRLSAANRQPPDGHVRSCAGWWWWDRPVHK
jgi:hypothetical protein